MKMNAVIHFIPKKIKHSCGRYRKKSHTDTRAHVYCILDCIHRLRHTRPAAGPACRSTYTCTRHTAKAAKKHVALSLSVGNRTGLVELAPLEAVGRDSKRLLDGFAPEVVQSR